MRRVASARRSRSICRLPRNRCLWRPETFAAVQLTLPTMTCIVTPLPVTLDSQKFSENLRSTRRRAMDVRRMGLRFGLLCAAAYIGPSLASTIAQAQDQGAAPATGQLEEIVVTSTKRTENGVTMHVIV